MRQHWSAAIGTTRVAYIALLFLLSKVVLHQSRRVDKRTKAFKSMQLKQIVKKRLKQKQTVKCSLIYECWVKLCQNKQILRVLLHQYSNNSNRFSPSSVFAFGLIFFCY